MKLHSNKLAILIELLIILFLIFAWFIHIIPFASTIYALVFVLVSIIVRKKGLKGIGLIRPRHWGLTLFLGILGGCVYQFLSLYAIEPFIGWITGSLPDLSNFSAIKGDTQFLLTWLAITWTVAAFGEEIIFRGMLLPCLSSFLGAGTSLVVHSLVFTGYHLFPMQNSLLLFIMGIFFGMGYLWGGSLVTPIVAHLIVNGLPIILIMCFPPLQRA